MTYTNEEVMKQKEERRENIIKLLSANKKNEEIAQTIGVTGKRLHKLYEKYDLRQLVKARTERIEAEDLALVTKHITRLEPIQDIAESIGMPYGRFQYIRKKYNLKYRSAVDAMQENYERGVTIETIAAALNVTPEVVRARLLGRGIVESTKYAGKVRKEYLDTLTDKQVWLFKKLTHQKGIKVKDAKELVSITEYPDKCPILGLNLVYGGNINNRASLASIDQIHAGEGYVKGNIHIISYKANRLKGDATVEDLEKIIAYLKNL